MQDSIIKLINEMTPFIFTVLGALIGALTAYLLTIKREKIKLTLEFHKELYGVEMSRHRRIGDACIKKFPEATYDELQKLDEENSLSVLIIMRFFQRLWHCARTNQLNNKMAGDMFFDIYCYWYIISYEENLVKSNKSWTAKEELPKLFEWLKNNQSIGNSVSIIKINTEIRGNRIGAYKEKKNNESK